MGGDVIGFGVVAAAVETRIRMKNESPVVFLSILVEKPMTSSVVRTRDSTFFPRFNMI
jgi:hypothetical protein